jgi:hypothetical protein
MTTAEQNEYGKFESIEASENSSAPTKVLRTYGGVQSGTKNYFFQIVFTASVLLLVVSLPLAFIYVPALVPIPDYKIDKGDKCWTSLTTKCDDNNIKQYIYFWNVTNPDQVLAGTHAPALKEVGPYVISKAVNKRQNITFSNYDQEVSFVSTFYGAMDTESFCDNCTMNDQIISFNLAYIGMVKTAGSETNILALMLPPTLSTLVAGVVMLFSGMALDPTLGAMFPNLVSALQSGTDAMNALALEQIFTAAPLGGISITQLASFGVPSSLLTGFPDVPEYANYAAVAASLPVSAVSIASPASTAMYTSIVSDPTGLTGIGILSMTPAAVATAYSISAAQAQLWQGYLAHIMGTYAANAFRVSLGPVLGPTSGGMLIKRPVQEWIFGYTDPVVSARYATDDPRRIMRFVTKIRDLATVEVDHVPWTVADTSKWAYTYGSTPYRLATGVGSPEEATDILQRSDGGVGAIAYPHSAHLEKVTGKDIIIGQYHDIKKHGASVDVTAWADFGMGLDLKRSVTLRHQPGRAVEKNAKVSVETFTIAFEEYLPCPINQTSCGRNTVYHGSFNTSGFEIISSVYTLPHGHRADPRVYGGYIDPSSPSSPFRPDESRHDIEFFIYERTGNTMGMRVPIQQNFKIEPTDVFYKTLWQSGSGSEVFVPITWTSLEYDMSKDFYTSIEDTITHIELLVVTWTYICPAICFMGILFSGVKLYVRSALNRRLVDDAQFAKDASRDESRALGSFRDKNLVQGLKTKDEELLAATRSDAPASATSHVVDIAPA